VQSWPGLWPHSGGVAARVGGVVLVPSRRSYSPTLADAVECKAIAVGGDITPNLERVRCSVLAGCFCGGIHPAVLPANMRAAGGSSVPQANSARSSPPTGSPAPTVSASLGSCLPTPGGVSLGHLRRHRVQPTGWCSAKPLGIEPAGAFRMVRQMKLRGDRPTSGGIAAGSARHRRRGRNTPGAGASRAARRPGYVQRDQRGPLARVRWPVAFTTFLELGVVSRRVSRGSRPFHASPVGRASSVSGSSRSH